MEKNDKAFEGNKEKQNALRQFLRYEVIEQYNQFSQVKFAIFLSIIHSCNLYLSL